MKDHEKPRTTPLLTDYSYGDPPRWELAYLRRVQEAILASSDTLARKPREVITTDASDVAEGPMSARALTAALDRIATGQTELPPVELGEQDNDTSAPELYVNSVGTEDNIRHITAARPGQGLRFL